MTGEASTPRVLYVGGAGRSGSTLLGQVLGQVPGFVHVGELVFVWRRGVLDNQLCGCGQPFLDCPFWTAVGEQAFGGWSNADADAAETQQRQVERSRHIPALLVPQTSSSFRSQLAGYVERMAALYAAVKQVSGATVIVETSKGPSHALMLRRVHDLDLLVCLLVRDSRGVAYSWTRRKRRHEVQGDDAFMDTYSMRRTAAEWTSFNAAFTAAPALGIPLQRIKYEDFIAQPDRAVRRLVGFAAGPGIEVPDIFGPGTVRLAADHSMAGNPIRFTSGEVALRADEEWRSAMPAGQRRAMTLITAPWLLRYGYLRRSGSADHSKSRPR
jgi:hypothetical protein